MGENVTPFQWSKRDQKQRLGIKRSRLESPSRGLFWNGNMNQHSLTQLSLRKLPETALIQHRPASQVAKKKRSAKKIVLATSVNQASLGTDPCQCNTTDSNKNRVDLHHRN